MFISYENTVGYVYLSKYSRVCLPPTKIQLGAFTSYQNTVGYVYLLSQYSRVCLPPIKIQ